MAGNGRAALSVAHSTEGVIVKTSGGLSEDWTYRRYKPEDVWAYQPVRKPDFDRGMGTGEWGPRNDASIPLSPFPCHRFVPDSAVHRRPVRLRRFCFCAGCRRIATADVRRW